MTATTIRVQMAQRKDTAANWTAANPILLSGEIGYETDTKKFKIGNGSTNWNSLAYLPIPDGSGNLTITGNLEIGSTGSLTFEGSTADGFETTLAVTNPTADRTITLPNQSGNVLVSGNASIIDADIAANAEIAVSKLADGTARQLLQTDAAGTGVEWASNVDIPGTLDVTGAATFDAAVTVAGDLTVNGTTTTISTQNLLVEDKNIIIGDVATPTDVTADGGGITLKGATDKTINWVDATDAWTSSERFSVPLGTAALPSLTFTGDTNTGIYSPGADQVAISTGGSGRLFVDASGNVGVATGAPSYRLEVNGTISQSSQGTSSALIQAVNAGGIFYHGLDNSAGTTFGQAYAAALWHSGAYPILFATNGSERLRITSAGLVGIGNTTGLGGTLGVSGHISLSGAATGARYLALLDETNTYAGSYVLQAGGGSAGFGGAITMYGHSHATYPGSVYIGTSASSGGKVYIGTNNALDPASARMTVTTTGVGIGTSSPQSALDIASGYFQSVRTYLSSIIDTYHQYRGTPDGVGYEHARVFSGRDTSVHTYGSYLAFYTEGKSSGTTDTSIERLRIDSSGRVGIGTTSPARALDVNGSIQLPSNNALYINGSNNYLYADSTTTELASATSIKFVANSAERARIDSSGRLLVGTSSVIGNNHWGTAIKQQLADDIAGAAAQVTYSSTGADYYSSLELMRARGSASSPANVINGDFLGAINFYGYNSSGSTTNNKFQRAALIRCEVDGSPAGTADDMPGRLVFSTTADGASFPTERMRITSGGSLCINTANTQTARLSIEGSTEALYNAVFHDTRTGSTASALILFKRNTATVGNIQTTDVATSYVTSSDYRLKENVVAINDGITRLQQLKPSRFNFKISPNAVYDGFIAHEVQAVVPEAITGEKDAVDDNGNPIYQGIDQSKLVPLLTAALQEAVAKIESLEARLTAAGI